MTYRGVRDCHYGRVTSEEEPNLRDLLPPLSSSGIAQGVPAVVAHPRSVEVRVMRSSHRDRQTLWTRAALPIPLLFSPFCCLTECFKRKALT